MSDVETLLSEYIAEHRAGGKADPVAYLERLEGTDRKELAALIDGYLARSPGQKWDAEAYKGSDAERLVESLDRSLTGRSGLWPALLPQLRDRAKLKRREVVARLAAALDAGDREQKVERYYHEMEQGLLPAGGVSSKVLEALAAVVGSSAAALRRAGQAFPPGPGPGEADTVLARMTRPGPEYQGIAEEEAEVPAPAQAAPAERDEIDDLFLGG